MLLKNQIKNLVAIYSEWRQFYKLVLLSSLVSGIAVGAVVAYYDYQDHHQREYYEIQQINNLLDIIGRNIYKYDYESVGVILESLVLQENFKGVHLTIKVDGRDYELFNINPTNKQDFLEYEIVVKDVGDGSDVTVGNLKIAYQGESLVNNLVSGFRVSIAAFTIIFVPLVLFSIYQTSNFVLYPLDRLSDAIDDTIVSGEPVKTKFAGDTKFGRLSSQFNDMQEQLFSVQSNLRDSMDRLQDKNAIIRHQAQILDRVFTTLGFSVAHFTKDGSSMQLNANLSQTFSRLHLEKYLNKEGLLARTTELQLKTFELDGRRQDVHYRLDLRFEDNSIEQLTAIELEDGNYAMVTTDVTEAYRKEQSLVEAKKMEAVGELASGVTHDFNNVLAIVSASMEMMLLDYDRGEFDIERNIGNIYSTLEACQRASSVVNSLLAFARNRSIEIITVNIDACLHRIISILPVSLGPNIEVKLEINTRRYVDINVSMFETAIINMAINAQHAITGKGEIKIQLDDCGSAEVKAAGLNQEDDYIKIRFSDSGVGIPDNIMDKIFDPFVSSRANGEGSGLGLSMVYAFISRCKGMIKARNLENSGAEFTIYLPVCRNMKEQIANGASVTPLSLKNIDIDKRILIVEDEPSLLKHLEYSLSKINSKSIYTARTFKEANDLLDKLSARSVDVVISDIKLPDGSGTRALERAHRDCPDCILIAISGHLSKPENLPSGTHLLRKPFHIRDLVELITVLQPEIIYS